MSVSLPDRCKNVSRLKAHSPSSDKKITALNINLERLKGTLAQSDCPYTNVSTIIGKAGSGINDDAKISTDRTVYKKRTTNGQNIKEFCQKWGGHAVTSKKIPPVFFDSYKSILTIPIPPDNVIKEEFDKFVDTLTLMIKTWYLNAQYMGDVPGLFLEIDKSKPIWLSSTKEGFSSNFMLDQHVKEATIFGIVISLGLAGICFWKACK